MSSVLKNRRIDGHEDYFDERHKLLVTDQFIEDDLLPETEDIDEALDLGYLEDIDLD